jgi:phosphatidylglycerol:prolipoprotein diacylglycerol transferase
MILAAGDCWTWEIDPIILKIWGPIQLRWYGLMFLGVFVFGYLSLRWQLRRVEPLRVSGRADEMAQSCVNWTVASVLIGAWFGHRLFYEFDKVIDNPIYLIDVSRGLQGLASHGAAIGLLAMLYLFARKHKIPYSEMMDRFMISVAVAVILVRLGNFFNHEVYGRPTDVPWAVCLCRIGLAAPAGWERWSVWPGTEERESGVFTNLATEPRHPSQLYEALCGVLIVLILLWVDKKAGKE